MVPDNCDGFMTALSLMRQLGLRCRLWQSGDDVDNRRCRKKDFLVAPAQTGRAGWL